MSRRQDITLETLTFKAKRGSNKRIEFYVDMDNSNMLLTTEAVAKILRVSERTVQNYRTEGKLRFYKISPRVIRYRVGDVVEFLRDNSCCFYQREKAIELIRKYLVV